MMQLFGFVDSHPFRRKKRKGWGTVDDAGLTLWLFVRFAERVVVAVGDFGDRGQLGG
jgi:hypothetical protein